MDNAFSRIHPAVQAVYFIVVMILTMFILHPFFLIISFVSAVIFYVYIGGRKALGTMIKFIFPMSVLVALINPLFNHAGVTILCYLPSGNPLTLESLIFGGVSGVLFSGIMLWCMCLRYTMSSDRVIYLFGRAAPKLGLFISMILRFVPKLSARTKQVRAAQKSIGRDINQGSLPRRISNAIRIISVMIGWTMENSIDTADSLKSRGYGLMRRTSFSLFHFELRDGIVLALIIIFAGAVFTGYFSGREEFDYFPAISPVVSDIMDIFILCAYALLCIMPLMICIKEDVKWKFIQSEI